MPVSEKRGSKYSIFPNSSFAVVVGLPFGSATLGGNGDQTASFAANADARAQVVNTLK